MKGGLSEIHGSRDFKYNAASVITNDDNNVLIGLSMTQYSVLAKVVFE